MLRHPSWIFPVLLFAALTLALSACDLPFSPTPASPTLSPIASPSAAHSPAVALGDPCLVGKWTVTINQLVPANHAGSVAGGAGATLTLDLTGVGIIDFSRSQPALGTPPVHLTVTDRGALNVTVAARAGYLIFTITQNTATVQINGGTPQPYTATPGAYAYTCSSSSLVLTRSVSGDAETISYTR